MAAVSIAEAKCDSRCSHFLSITSFLGVERAILRGKTSALRARDATTTNIIARSDQIP